MLYQTSLVRLQVKSRETSAWKQNGNINISMVKQDTFPEYHPKFDASLHAKTSALWLS